MKNRIVTIAIVSLALAATPIFAARQQGHKPAPVRIVSMSQASGNVSLKLEDGRSIEVPERQVRIHAVTAKTAQSQSTPAPQPTVASLSAMGSSIPATARVVYGKDGSIRVVRIQVFSSADAAAASTKKAGSK